MNIVAICIYFFSFYILQTTVINVISVYGTKPDLMLTALLCLAMLRGKEEASVVAIFIGVALDLLWSEHFGIYTICLFVVVCVCGLLFESVFHHSFGTALMGVFIFSIAYGLMYTMFYYLPHGGLRGWYLLIKVILPAALYNAVLAMPIYGMMKRDRRLQSIS